MPDPTLQSYPSGSVIPDSSTLAPPLTFNRDDPSPSPLINENNFPSISSSNRTATPARVTDENRPYHTSCSPARTSAAWLTANKSGRLSVPPLAAYRLARSNTEPLFSALTATATATAIQPEDVLEDLFDQDEDGDDEDAAGEAEDGQTTQPQISRLAFFRNSHSMINLDLLPDFELARQRLPPSPNDVTFEAAAQGNANVNLSSISPRKLAAASNVSRSRLRASNFGNHILSHFDHHSASFDTTAGICPSVLSHNESRLSPRSLARSVSYPNMSSSPIQESSSHSQRTQQYHDQQKVSDFEYVLPSRKQTFQRPSSDVKMWSPVQPVLSKRADRSPAARLDMPSPIRKQTRRAALLQLGNNGGINRDGRAPQPLFSSNSTPTQPDFSYRSSPKAFKVPVLSNIPSSTSAPALFTRDNSIDGKISSPSIRQSENVVKSKPALRRTTSRVLSAKATKPSASIVPSTAESLAQLRLTSPTASPVLGYSAKLSDASTAKHDQSAKPKSLAQALAASSRSQNSSNKRGGTVYGIPADMCMIFESKQGTGGLVEISARGGRGKRGNSKDPR